MVPYFGSHSFKIFIRSKPICFVCKNWILASNCGYLLKFETYVGASEMRRDKSLDPCIVLNLLLIIKNSQQHCVCLDTFLFLINCW